MTPEEKAKELVDKFNKIHILNNYDAKQCALIAVNEMIEESSFADGYYNRQNF